MGQEVELIDRMAAEIEALREQNVNQRQAFSSPQNMFNMGQKPNLVEWQLDFRTELEDIEHLLRSDVLVRDAKGNETWERNTDKDSIVFNDRGVNDILREIRMLLNKNKVLSNYNALEIKDRMRKIGHEMRAFIYNNAEAYGIDNEYKENQYPIMVVTILDMIESAYRRALNGEERRDLNSARVVSQTEPITNGMPQSPYAMQAGKKRSVLKPWTW